MLGVSGSFTHVNWPHLCLTTKKDGKVFDPVILLMVCSMHYNVVLSYHEGKKEK